MADALSFPHQREVTRIARRFKEPPRRGFVVCTCADMEVRRAVEAALREQLGADSLARVEPDAVGADPWGAVLDAHGAEDRVVALHLPEAPAEETLRSLDVQRELLHGERVALMVWMPAADLERFSRLAPNLWSIRGHLAEFKTNADVELTAARELAGAETPAFSPEEELARIDDDLRWRVLGRTGLLLQRAQILQRSGRSSWEVLAALERARPRFGFRDRDERALWLRLRFDALLGAHRPRRAEATLDALAALVQPADWNGAGLVLSLRAHLLRAKQEWAPLLDLLEGLWRTLQTHPIEDASTQEAIAAAFRLLAEVCVSLQGRIDAGDLWLDRALATLPKAPSIEGHRVRARVQSIRAEMAWERLEIDDAIRHWEHARAMARRLGDHDAAENIEWHLGEADTALTGPGSPHAAGRREMKARIEAAFNGREVAPEAPAKVAKMAAIRAAVAAVAPDDRAPEPDDDLSYPKDHLLRAVLGCGFQKHVGDFSRAREQLAACQDAWDAEDPRCRSLCRYATWKGMELVLRCALGETDRLRAVFAEAAEQLRALPLTRLNFLVDFAGSEYLPELLPERRRAALEVLHTARPLGLVILERDAHAALAAIDASTGALVAAAGHRAAADAINAALPTSPSVTA